MGYNTDFDGKLTIEPPLNEHEISFLEDFRNRRHEGDDLQPLSTADDAAMPMTANQWDKPGIWLNWVAKSPSELVWSGYEKTYQHDAWLVWVIKHLFGPDAKEFVAQHKDNDPRLEHFTTDHIFNGVIKAEGQDYGDQWDIRVVDNEVASPRAAVSYGY